MATSLSAPGTHSEQAERLRSLFAEISRELAVNRAALVEYSVLAPYHRVVVRPQRVVVPVVAQVEARPPVALVLLALLAAINTTTSTWTDGRGTRTRTRTRTDGRTGERTDGNVDGRLGILEVWLGRPTR